MILQNLSRQSTPKLGWDDTISLDQLKKWEIWKSLLPKLENISIPRCFKPSNMGTITDAQLHVFSDGSETGYGACAYLRLVDKNNGTKCSLVLGKSRLAPLKQTTIPRLELSGAVGACKLYEIVRDELEIDINRVVFWTDSMILLGYIRNESRRFKTFVANRLNTTHTLTTPDQWRYVDTKSNPADIASRGVQASDSSGINFWINGPNFLTKDESEWPAQNTTIHVDERDVEIKKDVATHTTSVNSVRDILTYYSDWSSLQRAVAWLLRFKAYCKCRYLKRAEDIKQGNLTITELNDASEAILAQVQRESFPDEMKMLTSQKACKNNSRIVSLNPFMHNGLIRMKGRLYLPPSKCPVIIPSSHHVTTLLIRSYHKRDGHAGMAHVLSSLRGTFWLIKGPSTVRNVLKQCFVCRKNNSPLCTQKMAPIIADQKTPDKPPFSFIGIDYFGPLNVKVGRSIVKRYGCLITCLTTRAIHIEIAHSLTTDSFISAFQRFTCRRGIPEKAYSDNGTNIVGRDFMTQMNIQWHFNAPNASHAGGAWERMIRTTRKILNVLANEQLLTDEKLATVMAEAERIINDRPITVVSNDPRDLPVLTPSMLLSMKSNTSMPIGVFDEKDNYARRWWRQTQYLANVFWKRWIREYLPMLQKRQKWHHEVPSLKKGDIVLIADENKHRGQWPLGKVVDVIRSRDGLIRSCVVRTSLSIFTRPISKLCLLECSQ